MGEHQTKSAEPKPYSGLVQATTDCCIGTRRYPGDVFTVENMTLWTDDPFVPVSVIGTRDDGSPLVEPAKVAAADFRTRKSGSATEDPTPRRPTDYV